MMLELVWRVREYVESIGLGECDALRYYTNRPLKGPISLYPNKFSRYSPTLPNWGYLFTQLADSWTKFTGTKA